WTFPSGATLEFGSVKDLNDAYRFGGLSAAFIGIDNATYVEKDTYLFLRARARTTIKDIPVRIRAASQKIGKGVAWVEERFLAPQTKAPGVVFVSGQRGSNPYINQEMY